MIDLGAMQKSLEKMQTKHRNDTASMKRALAAYQRSVLKANESGASVEMLAHELNSATFALTSKV